MKETFFSFYFLPLRRSRSQNFALKNSFFFSTSMVDGDADLSRNYSLCQHGNPMNKKTSFTTLERLFFVLTIFAETVRDNLSFKEGFFS